MRVKSLFAALSVGISLAGFIPLANAQSYRQVYSFHGVPHNRNPRSELVQFGDRLFGTTPGGDKADCSAGCGEVFSVDLKTGKLKLVHVFDGGADGAFPRTGLTQFGHLLYGTTSFAGGSVFSLDPSTGVLTTIHRFGSSGDDINPNSSLLVIDGLLYGEAVGNPASAIYAIDPTTGNDKIIYSFTAVGDASQPQGGLLNVNGVLFGTSVYGGSTGNGTVFSLDLSTGTEIVLHSFGTGKDGSQPLSHLTKVENRLFGTTYFGGSVDGGTVFSVELKTGQEKVVYSFMNGADGAYPLQGLRYDAGFLYGTTSFSSDPTTCGALYSLDVANESEANIHGFQGGTDGCSPAAGLIGIGDTLYGTTEKGGTLNRGTVFGYTP